MASALKDEAKVYTTWPLYCGVMTHSSVPRAFTLVGHVITELGSGSVETVSVTVSDDTLSLMIEVPNWPAVVEYTENQKSRQRRGQSEHTDGGSIQSLEYVDTSRRLSDS